MARLRKRHANLGFGRKLILPVSETYGGFSIHYNIFCRHFNFFHDRAGLITNSISWHIWLLI